MRIDHGKMDAPVAAENSAKLKTCSLLHGCGNEYDFSVRATCNLEIRNSNNHHSPGICVHCPTQCALRAAPAGWRVSSPEGEETLHRWFNT